MDLSMFFLTSIYHLWLAMTKGPGTGLHPSRMPGDSRRSLQERREAKLVGDIAMEGGNRLKGDFREDRSRRSYRRGARRASLPQEGKSKATFPTPSILGAIRVPGVGTLNHDVWHPCPLTWVPPYRESLIRMTFLLLN